MKFVMEERVKHRLTGVVVIVAIAIVFVPALMKKSSQHIEESVNFSVRLPDKPNLPKVAVASESSLLNSVKTVRLDKPIEVKEPPMVEMAKADSISETRSVLSPINLLSKNERDVASIPAESKAQEPQKPINKVAKTEKIVPTVSVSAARTVIQSKTVAKAIQNGIKKDTYAVQLAAFSQRNNAKLLVNRLQGKGFKASYDKVMSKNKGSYYRVIVGQLNQKQEAELLQKRLYSQLQLHGFVIKTGVS